MPNRKKTEVKKSKFCEPNNDEDEVFNFIFILKFLLKKLN